MTTQMERRNNAIIAGFLSDRVAELLWASRVSGLGLDDMIRECLHLGWERFLADMETLESEGKE